MEPNQFQNPSQQTNFQKPNDDLDFTEKPFCDRPFEEVEDGYIDDRGFYTTPNGSFWDDEHTYFNHLGFDRFGGSYDKYGIYHPGNGYDENTGLYKEQKEFITGELKEAEKNIGMSISKLKDQERNDEITMKKFEKLEVKVIGCEQIFCTRPKNLYFNKDTTRLEFETDHCSPILIHKNYPNSWKT